MFPSLEELPHATAHHDSVLFAVCVAILLARVVEKPTWRSLKIAALLLPIYAGGVLANNRRLVWAEIAVCALFLLVVSRMGTVKRVVLRTAAVSVLPALIYLAAGWNSTGGKLFGPVRTVRSMVDGNVDSSTRWRDLENYDLVTTWRQGPLLGSGFGHPYIEASGMLPEITDVYALEPYVPHNSVLGLWAFGGLLGFALLWAIYPVGFFFTILAYRSARTPIERIGALGAAAMEICYLMQAYGDLGFGTWGPVFSLAAAWAVAGKLCVANGAWGAARP
jgi:O-antigen ligase